jgi:hypothetical protein
MKNLQLSIERCLQCPYCEEGKEKGWGTGSYYCRKMYDNEPDVLRRKNLRIGDKNEAYDGVPEWCPLPEKPEELPPHPLYIGALKHLERNCLEFVSMAASQDRAIDLALEWIMRNSLPSVHQIDRVFVVENPIYIRLEPLNSAFSLGRIKRYQCLYIGMVREIRTNQLMAVSVTKNQREAGELAEAWVREKLDSFYQGDKVMVVQDSDYLDF